MFIISARWLISSPQDRERRSLISRGAVLWFMPIRMIFMVLYESVSSDKEEADQHK